MSYAHFFFALSRLVETIVASGGYPFLFIMVVLEGMPLVGTVVPGHVAVILAGFLSRIGIFNMYWVILIGIAGAILGDYIGFFLGKKYGMSLLTRLQPFFFIKESHIDKARKMLDTHTGKAMFLGRFSPITRALMPFLVGTGEISAGKFWFYNVLGGVSWVVTSVFIGYIFGEGYNVISGYLGKFAVIAILASFLIIWGYRYINTRFHIFARYELLTLGLNVVSLVVLAKTIQDAWAEQSFMANFDVLVNIFMDKVNHLYPAVVIVATWITNIGSTTVMICLGTLFGVVLLMRKRWRLGVIFLSSTAVSVLSLGVLKEFFVRSRPENTIMALSDPSFPSGHAGMAAAFFVVLAYLLAPRIHSWVEREITLIGLASIVIVIGLSRLVLNVHWASDVIAGWSLGIFIATGSILFVRYVGALLVRK